MLPSCSGILVAVVCTTIRPEFGVLTDLFLLFARDRLRKYMVLFHLIILLYTTIRSKIRVLIDLFLLCAHDHWTEIYVPVLFIISFVHNHSTKMKDPH